MGSIFQEIETLACSSAPSNPRAKWQPSIGDCVCWLEAQGLTRSVDPYQIHVAENTPRLPPAQIQLGLPCQRTEKSPKAVLEDLKKKYAQSYIAPTGATLERLWRECKEPASAIRALDFHRLPADALAFYRPFHFAPYDEWGIYIRVDLLLSHSIQLYDVCRSKISAFNLEILLGCMLFEVFHHEFFHHLTECAATTIEILSAAYGPPRPFYNEYWTSRFAVTPGYGPHPDHPLEEALANTYAYNSFSFLSRTQFGYKSLWVRLCKVLRMPMIASQFATLAEQAIREKKSHVGYLEALLAAEVEERERNTIERRIREAHLPRMKTLEEFDFTQSPNVNAAKMRDLAEGGYIERAEPILFIGECGTGKTHLLTGLCVAACRQKRRVRFTTAAGLVNELVEAKHQLQLRRVLARWSRYDLIAIDEVGYVPLAEVGAEFLFQVVAERAEKAAVILTTNLPFSEWTQVIPNARLCKALLDRITDRAHILETGTESYRFRRTAEKQKKGAKAS